MLDLWGNHLTALPEEMGKLTHLKDMRLGLDGFSSKEKRKLSLLKTKVLPVSGL